MLEPKVIVPMLREPEDSERLFGLPTQAYRSVTEEEFRALLSATLVAVADSGVVGNDRIAAAFRQVSEVIDPSSGLMGDEDSFLGTFWTVAQYIDAEGGRGGPTIQ